MALRPSASGAVALISGDIDNLQDLAGQLGLDDVTPERVYAAAWDRWGNTLDMHVVGDYASVLVLPDQTLRLARSPWRARPLHYWQHGAVTAVATTPRVLLAAGMPNRLNERKLADNLFLHLREDDGWYAGSRRVDLGCSVTLLPDGSVRQESYYDHFTPRVTSLPRRQDYVDAADALIREASAKALAGGVQPGVFLSGGLDSSNVAARAIDFLPHGKRLKSFTWRPHPDFKEPPEDSYFFGDDWPAVEKFAERHPRIEPFCAHSMQFDDGWEKLFLAMGQAPSGLCNMSLYIPVCEMANAQGCDLMLDADMGNNTFSNSGDWACSQLLRQGEWGKLFKTVSSFSNGPAEFSTRLFRKAIIPNLPDVLWKAWRRLKGRDTTPAQFTISTARGSALADYDTIARASATNFVRSRWHVATRQEELHAIFDRGEMQGGDVTHGFEQVYGFRWRDVSAYRPLVEFCHGLPPELFVHDGQTRWLARELGKGLIPEVQRTRHRYGYHNCDWHEKMTPRLEQLRNELREAAQDPQIAAILDFEKLEEVFETWPEAVTMDDATSHSHGMALPRALLTKRYIEFVNGRNA